MLRKTQPVGLYYTAEQLQLAQEHRDTEPIPQALAYLTQTMGDNSLAKAQLAGLRYQFFGDDASGLQAIEGLQQVNLPTIDTSNQDTIKNLLGWLNVIESVRSHSTWADHQTTWFETLSTWMTSLDEVRDDVSLLDGLWLGALDIGAGIVLDDETLFNRGADIYRLAIDEHIHPEGYLKGIVDVLDATDTYQQQVSGTTALVLMSEMAKTVGVDLWSVNNRGVTPVTATAYLLYYYYYPEKWKWADDLTRDITEAIIKTDGAFLEIANHHETVRGLDILFDELRPLFGVTSGGLTTLTHGVAMPPKKKRWGLFG
jgi:hypothetical protein